MYHKRKQTKTIREHLKTHNISKDCLQNKVGCIANRIITAKDKLIAVVRDKTGFINGRNVSQTHD